MKIIPNPHDELNQEHSVQSTAFSHRNCSIRDKDSLACASTHQERKLVPYSSLNPDQLKRLEQMGLTPHQTNVLSPVEIHFQEWGSDLWIGKNINPLLVDRFLQLKRRRKKSRIQVCKAIQDAAIRLGFYPGAVIPPEVLKTTHKHLPSRV